MPNPIPTKEFATKRTKGALKHSTLSLHKASLFPLYQSFKIPFMFKRAEEAKSEQAGSVLESWEILGVLKF